MLDFFDYNFSSLVSIFAALMGIAYPLVLQAIQRIDEMYKSTKLAAFFLKQWYFRLFSCLLLLTIPISIVVPFLLCSCNDNWMLIVSAVYAIIVFALAMSTFVLFKYIMMTTNPSSFFKYLEIKLKGSHPPLVEIFQIQKYASDKDDDELFSDVTRSVLDYLHSYKSNKSDDVAIEIWRMYRELYKQHSIRENHFFSIRNLIANYFFSDVDRIELTEEEFIYIWKTIDAVLHVGNESWVYAYWSAADQYFRSTYENPIDGNKQNRCQQERFKEQHFMIGTLLAYNKRYVLLNRLMYFSNTQPPHYALVPSTFIDIVSWLKHMIKMSNVYINLTNRYTMIGAPQDVSSDKFILRYVYKYASLLIVRLFTVNNWNITDSEPMALPNIPNTCTIEKLNSEVCIINRLKEQIFSWFGEKNAINVTIGEGRVDMNDVLRLCDEYIEKNEDRIEELRKSSKVDPRKREYIKSHLLSALSNRPLALPIIDDVSDSGYKKQKIKNNYIRQIDKEVLKAGTYVNASALPDVIIDYLNELAYKAYNYLFLIHSSVRTVRIAYKDFKRVMDVIGVNEDFSILSLGVYLGNYEESYGKKEDVKFVNMESCFSYKNSKIYSILSAQQSVLVMKKSDIPFVRKEKVTDETKLKLINEEEYFYSNIDDINDLSENEVQFLKVNRGIYLYSKERFRYIRLTIDYNPGFVTEMNKVKEAREVTWP